MGPGYEGVQDTKLKKPLVARERGRQRRQRAPQRRHRGRIVHQRLHDTSCGICDQDAYMMG